MRNATDVYGVHLPVKSLTFLGLLLLLMVPRTADAAKASQNVVLAVRGMHCSSCSVGIEAMLRRSTGVTRATVNYARREALVDFDAEKTSPARIVRTIENLGYKATVRK